MIKQSAFSRYAPGIIIVFIVAAAAEYLSTHLSGPVMLYALLLGTSLSFLSDEGKTKPGIQISSKPLMQIAVALLGAQVTWNEITSLGLAVVFFIATAIIFTLVTGILVAKAFKQDAAYGFISATAVAICGVSAAMAISSVLPKDKKHPEKLEIHTSHVIIGITTLSSITMVFYPTITTLLGLSTEDSALFLGTTIHDVAQVIGAGYMLSPETGEVATLIKLIRITYLVPVVLILGYIANHSATAQEPTPAATKRPNFPAFLIGFIALLALNSIYSIPKDVTELLATFSHWCLVAAVVALGMKTSLQKFFALGFKPVATLVIQTLLLAGFTLAYIFT